MAKNINKDKLPHEIFDLIEKASERKRPELLEQLGDNFSVKTLLQLNFSSRIELAIPEGPPPYTPAESDAGPEASRIQRVLRPLGQLLKSNTSLPPYKKEGMFVTMCESLHAKDAEILVACKDKDLEILYPSITQKLVESVWPTLLMN